MLYQILVTLFVINCFLLALLILVQKGKGSLGMGSLGGGQQMLFGGSGGQDLFQKITWILTIIFMFGSLGISILRTSRVATSKYSYQAPIHQEQTPEAK